MLGVVCECPVAPQHLEVIDGWCLVVSGALMGDEAAGENWDMPKALLWRRTSWYHSQHPWEEHRRVWGILFIFILCSFHNENIYHPSLSLSLSQSSS